MTTEHDAIRERYEAGLAYAQEYFMGEADVQKAARKVTARLAELGMPYAVAGGLAVTAHGHVRVTMDVDLVVTRDDLARFKAESLGRGWAARFPVGKGVRDAEHRVPIDFLVTGEFPGDGLPKPVAFPDPRACSTEAGDTRIVTLATLVELKLASGMTAPDRPRDLDDVVQLIRANDLPITFAAGLHPWVRDKFAELWRHAQIRREE